VEGLFSNGMGGRTRVYVSMLGICCAGCGLSAVGLYVDGNGDGGDAVADGSAADVGDGGVTDANATADVDVGDACDDGGCLPITVSRGHVSPVGIAISGQRLFWSVDSPSAQAVIACDLPACATPAAIATGQPRTVVVMTNATHVFWARDNGVRSCPVLGCVGAPAVIANGTDTNGLYVRGGRVFWTDYLTSGPVGAADALGTNPVTLGSSQSFPRRIAANATHAYWTNFGAGTIARSAATTGPPTTLVTGQTDPWDMTIDATNIYWTNATTVGVCALAGCPANGNVLASGLSRPLGITSDGVHVYWTNRNAGTVVRCPVTGCGAGPTTLATGQLDPYAITTDAQFVYWTNRGATGANDPSIMKMRKQ
jgi:virginiamycin B lyase